jgi:hypothetical protein
LVIGKSYFGPGNMSPKTVEGRFKFNLLPYLLKKTIGVTSPTQDHGIEVTIDYRESSPLQKDCERAKELYDRGWLNCQIASALGCAKSWVAKLLNFWFASRGQTMPDGRSRRSTLARKQVQPPNVSTPRRSGQGLVG